MTLGKRKKNKKQEQKDQKRLEKKELKSLAKQERQSPDDNQIEQADLLRMHLEQNKANAPAMDFAPWVVAIIAFICFAGSLEAPFLFDDALVVTHNPMIHDWSWPGVFKFALNNSTRSLSNLTFYLNYHMAGTTPYPPFGPTWTYHLVSVLLHSLNSALVFLLIRGLLKSPYFQNKDGIEALSPEAQRPAFIAFISALLFAVHPAQTMAVAYIAQRYALIAAACLLGTLVSYLRYRRLSEQGNKWAPSYLFLALGLSGLCYLSKENTAVVGFLVIAIELFFLGGKKIGQASFFAVPFFLGIAVRGTLSRDNPAFEISPSTTVGYTLVIGLALGLVALATFAWRLLPDDFPGRAKDLGGTDRRSQKWLGPAAISLLIAAALVAFVGCFMVHKAGSYRSSLNALLMLTTMLVACRLYFRSQPGLLPGRALLSFVLIWLVFLIANNAGTENTSTLDFLFPAPANFAPEHAHKQYFLTQLRALLFYPRLMFLPWGYSAEHAYSLTPIILDPPHRGQVFMRFAEFLAMLAHIGIFVLAIRNFKRARILSFAIIWFYLTLFVTSSFIPILDPLVEQRMYLPLALAMTALVVFVARLLGYLSLLGQSDQGMDWKAVARGMKQRLTSTGYEALPASAFRVKSITVTFGFGLVLLAMFSQGRVKVWQDRESIWLDAIEKRPDCSRAYSSLGMVRLNIANELKSDGKIEEADIYWLKAIESIGTAVEFGRYHVEGWNNLGKAYLEMDNDRSPHERAHNKRRPNKPTQKIYDPLLEAERCFREGVIRGQEIAELTGGGLGPAVPLCLNNLGLVYRRLSLRYLPPMAQHPETEKAVIYMDKALQAIEDALRVHSKYVGGLTNLGTLRVDRAGFEPDPFKRYQLAQGSLVVLGRAIRSGRASPRVFRKVVDAYILIGNTDQALKILRGIADRDGTLDPNLYKNLCFDLGMKAYRRLVDLRERFSETRFTTNNELQGIVTVLETALEFKHDQKGLLYASIGKLNEMDRQPRKALKVYKLALQVDPKGPDSATIRRIVRKLEALHKNGE
jgi:tetratricopeptide (TPR) repeat protein